MLGATITTPVRSLRAQVQSRCVVCGRDHPHGLRIHYDTAGDGAVSAAWTPTPDWEGFRGIVHGGIVSTVLDETMSKAVAATGCEALTGELRVRFRRCVTSGERLQVRGWIVRRTKRLIETEATLSAPDGKERAHAWATFLTLPRLQERSRATLDLQTEREQENEDCGTHE